MRHLLAISGAVEVSIIQLEMLNISRYSVHLNWSVNKLNSSVIITFDPPHIGDITINHIHNFTGETIVNGLQPGTNYVIKLQPYFLVQFGIPRNLHITTFLADPSFASITFDSKSINFSISLEGQFSILIAEISSLSDFIAQSYTEAFKFPGLSIYVFQDLTPGQTYQFDIGIQAGSDEKRISETISTRPSDPELVSSAIIDNQIMRFELYIEGLGTFIYYEIVDTQNLVQMNKTKEIEPNFVLEFGLEYFGMDLRIKTVSAIEGNFVQFEIGVAKIETMNFTKLANDDIQVNYTMTSELYTWIQFQIAPDPDPRTRGFDRHADIFLENLYCGKVVNITVIPFHDLVEGTWFKQDLAVDPCFGDGQIAASDMQLESKKGFFLIRLSKIRTFLNKFFFSFAQGCHRKLVFFLKNSFSYCQSCPHTPIALKVNMGAGNAYTTDLYVWQRNVKTYYCFLVSFVHNLLTH